LLKLKCAHSRVHYSVPAKYLPVFLTQHYPFSSSFLTASFLFLLIPLSPHSSSTLCPPLLSSYLCHTRNNLPSFFQSLSPLPSFFLTSLLIFCLQPAIFFPLFYSAIYLSFPSFSLHGTSYTVTRGRILERNPDSYSQPHVLRISISSNSRNLLKFLQFITVHCKRY
jgi:hypothetical protein